MEDNKIKLQERKAEIEERISVLESEAAQHRKQQQGTKIKVEKLNEMSEESKCNEEISALKEELSHIEYTLASFKRFNRERCLENIDFLLAQKDVCLL